MNLARVEHTFQRLQRHTRHQNEDTTSMVALGHTTNEALERDVEMEEGLKSPSTSAVYTVNMLTGREVVF